VYVQAELWSVPQLESCIVKLLSSVQLLILVSVRVLCCAPCHQLMKLELCGFLSCGVILNTARMIKTAHTLCCDHLVLDNKLKSVSIGDVLTYPEKS